MNYRFILPFLLTLFIISSPCLLAGEDNPHVSPLYFGPNALPVPDMLDGTLHSRLYGELALDFHAGYYGDLTETIFAKVNIPLFTPRVNLSLWMPVIEFFDNTPASLAHQDSEKRKDKGYTIGNVYISTDIQVLKQARIRPDITIRAAVITASGDNDEYARYYDAPGYFFDASIAKSIGFDHRFFKDLRFVLNGGFLCWQTSQTVQNDAWMYGLMAKLKTSVFDLACTWQGYNGWQKNGDMPMTVKVDIRYNRGCFRPLFQFEHGLRDYLYNHFRLGLGYAF